MSQVLEKSRIEGVLKLKSDAVRRADDEQIVDESHSFVPNEMNAIRIHFLPAQQGQFSPVEWDEVDEEVFDV